MRTKYRILVEKKRKKKLKIKTKVLFTKNCDFFSRNRVKFSSDQSKKNQTKWPIPIRETVKTVICAQVSVEIAQNWPERERTIKCLNKCNRHRHQHREMVAGSGPQTK